MGADPTSAIDDVDHILTAANKGNEEFAAEEAREKTIARLKQLLGEKVVMMNIEGSDYTGLSLTVALKALRRLIPDPADTSGSAVGEKNKQDLTSGVKHQAQGTMFLLCAELFPQHVQQHSPEAFRGVIGGISTGFKELAKWACTAKQAMDVVIISDGRSDAARRQIRELLKTIVGDDFTELWVIYDMDTTLHTDVRNPKRKVAWSSANMETIFALLPEAIKGQRPVIARDLFNKCGESTNFSRSYSGVPFRNLAEIPRVTPDAKRKILGYAAVGAFSKSRAEKEVESKGHPLFWGEWKPVHLFSTLFRDFLIADVVDMTPGSGAACIASLYSSTPYHAICHNDAHQQYLQGLIQRIFTAMVLNKEVATDADMLGHVESYLQRTAEAAKHMLPRKTPAVGDSLTGDDDSDEEQ